MPEANLGKVSGTGPRDDMQNTCESDRPVGISGLAAIALQALQGGQLDGTPPSHMCWVYTVSDMCMLPFKKGITAAW
jgi:hypothetical protein